MAKGKEKSKTIKVHVVIRYGMGVDLAWSVYKTFTKAKEEANEGDEIYSGELTLQGTLQRVVQ